MHKSNATTNIDLCSPHKILFVFINIHKFHSIYKIWNIKVNLFKMFKRQQILTTAVLMIHILLKVMHIQVLIYKFTEFVHLIINNNHNISLKLHIDGLYALSLSQNYMIQKQLKKYFKVLFVLRTVACENCFVMYINF